MTAGPPTSIEPPRAGLPFTVSNSCAVSTSQITAPVVVEYARRCPSIDPENTTPGIAVTAADWAGEQLVRPSTQGDRLALQTILPDFRSSACSPPPFSGSRTDRNPSGNVESGLVPSPMSLMAT